ncbi:MAG: class I SAM-dependent methyltransferase [Actinomycetota bacterium]|nr:class I SAM-dependent methyltransferase [Actinomycetota bacterium]
MAIEPLLGARPGSRWLDLGTGGGLPGLALAVIRPDVTWTLVDATAKKIESVRAFAAELGLENVTALAGRAETLAHRPELRGRYGGVVSRAVAPLGVLAELARGFLVDQGVLLAVKGPRWSAELRDARAALEILGFVEPQAVEVPTTERPTWLVTMRAQGPVPPGFPRRDGVPRAKPLGRPRG